jgi:hypothetical protein
MKTLSQDKPIERIVIANSGELEKKKEAAKEEVKSEELK